MLKYTYNTCGTVIYELYERNIKIGNYISSIFGQQNIFKTKSTARCRYQFTSKVVAAFEVDVLVLKSRTSWLYVFWLLIFRRHSSSLRYIMQSLHSWKKVWYHWSFAVIFSSPVSLKDTTMVNMLIWHFVSFLSFSVRVYRSNIQQL